MALYMRCLRTAAVSAIKCQTSRTLHNTPQTASWTSTQVQSATRSLMTCHHCSRFNHLATAKWLSPYVTSVFTSRSQSSYNPYPDIKTPSPYKEKKKNNYGYRLHAYDGGVLPRPEGKFADIPLPIPKWRLEKKDQWTQKKALFGQNDYIDILGDGSVHPAQTIRGPAWLKAFKGNELQRLVRRFKFQGAYMREMYPTKHHNIKKRIWFLYKRLNRRKKAKFWGSKSSSAKSRIHKIMD